MNTKGEYDCLFRYENETKDYITLKTCDVYSRSQLFVYECLKDPKHQEYFHKMINKMNMEY